MMNTEYDRTLVKLCGLRRLQDAEAANRARPDLAGMILSPGFRRSIDPVTACGIRRVLDPGIRTVGVFVDADPEEIDRIADSGCIDMIQLHGKEDESVIRRIQVLTGLPVVKAFRIRERADLAAAAESAADWILLDSGSGTGRSFDWEMLELFLKENGPAAGRTGEARCRENAEDIYFPGGHRWLLAGGLSTENVAEAVRRLRPTGVDVSSLVETDGWKDPAKMKAFVEAVRNASEVNLLRPPSAAAVPGRANKH